MNSGTCTQRALEPEGEQETWEGGKVGALGGVDLRTRQEGRESRSVQRMARSVGLGFRLKARIRPCGSMSLAGLRLVERQGWPVRGLNAMLHPHVGGGFHLWKDLQLQCGKWLKQPWRRRQARTEAVLQA